MATVAYTYCIIAALPRDLFTSFEQLMAEYNDFTQHLVELHYLGCPLGFVANVGTSTYNRGTSMGEQDDLVRLVHTSVDI